jgi:two-component system response regulator
MSEAEQEIEVLLVEDTATDAELCIRTLKRHIGRDVVWVKNGSDALDYLFGAAPDAEPGRLPKLILLDLHLPKVHGFDVLRKIRESCHTRRIPVVVLTSSKERRDIIESYDLGANSYISKPVDFDAFVTSVTQLGHYWLALNHSPHEKV